jgi:Chitin synthase N-terminal
MATGRKVLSYRYVQGTSSAPSLHEDDYQDDDDDDYDDYDAEEPRISPPRHSPLGGSKTLQYALASSSSQSPGIPTFDTITEAVTRLQSRYPSSSTSASSAALPHPTVRTATPPYERPPSSASSATSYTVATDYAAPAKISPADRFEPAIRPSFQQPPYLPTIDSGEPLQLDNLKFNANNDDPFSDGSQSRQQTIVSYPQVLQHRSLGPFASRDDTGSFASAEEVHHPERPPSQLSATSTQSRGSSNGGPPSVRGVTPTPRQVLQMPALLQDSIAEPSVSLVSRPNAAQQPQQNPYDSFHSQALTPLANRIVQRRSPLKPVSPIDHFRHDTEAYASGRNSLPAYTIPHSRSSTPVVGGDSYGAVGTDHTGSSHYAGTHYTGMSQDTDGTVGIDGREYDEESLDGDKDDEGEDKKGEKPMEKSMFQEFLDKARNDPLLNQTLEEKPITQSVFADPRRVVFPDPQSPLTDIPGTPVGTRHFGPAPIGRVARRNKTMKRVPLTNGNLVLDLPVPPKLVLPRVGHPEVMKTRYTAVTCDPDDFEKNGHFLRQNQMNRRTELFICITMFNVSSRTSCVPLIREAESVPRKTRFCSVELYTA